MIYRKSIYYVLLIVCLGFSNTFAQPYETNPDYKRANIWHFGAGAGIDFNSGSPVPIAGGQTGHTWEGFSTLCDTGGNLMFYTDGQTVWNKNHNVVENGTGLMAHTSSTQGSLLLQHPENDSIVYLFTTPSAVNLNTGLRYNIINTKIGNGKVVVKNKLLLTPTTEKLTAINHANGRDIWVIAHGYTSNSYFSYLLTKNGLVECPVESVTGNILEDVPALWNLNTQGNLIANYKGDRVSNAVLHTGKVETFHFDNQTGKLEILDTISFNTNVYCVAYNKKSDRLFIQTVDADRDTSYFYYYENKKLVLISKYLHGKIQYMVNYNDIIYIGNMDSMHVSTIENLNDSIPLFNAKALDLNPSIGSVCLNNFNSSYQIILPINFTVKLNCVLNTVQLYGQDTFQANSHNWEIFKNGSNPITASIKAPLIDFEDTGVYFVRYIASNGARSDTMIKTIEILPKIEKNFLGKDTGWCNIIGAPITLQAPSGMHCYEWSTGETTPQITADTAGIYIAKITTPNFCVIYDTVIVSIDTIETITSNFLGEDKTWCENIDTSVVLNAIEGYNLYTWNNNSNELQITVNEEGIYYVEAFKRNQCSSGGDLYAYDSIEITFLNAPDKPLLNREDDSLFITTSESYGYNWYRNNSLLSDTTEYLILPDTGYYFLKITSTNGCSNNSDTIHVATLGIDNPLFAKIKLYPNPANGIITIELLNINDYTFKISSLNGKIISKGKLNQGTNNIDISRQSDGIYFITISSNEQTITYKVIKQTE